MQSTPTASINEENNTLNVVCLPGLIQLETSKPINNDVQIELIDLSGKVIANAVAYFETSYSLPVQFYTNGIYVLNVRSENISFSKKVFIRH